mgnify:FL=1
MSELMNFQIKIECFKFPFKNIVLTTSNVFRVHTWFTDKTMSKCMSSYWTTYATCRMDKT